jgi:hypothetical protein
MSESSTPHDVGKERDPRTGGDKPVTPNPAHIEQGSKNPDVRDAGDRADRPNPNR